MSAAPIREVEDPAALRALAHPLRLRLLGSLRSDGPATASMLGRRLGESSGATSFHLRTLARHGFVEDDAERGTARERWWRAVHRGTSWELAPADRGRAEAGRELTRQLVAEHARRVLEFVDAIDEWDPAWRESATISDQFVTATPERLVALQKEMAALVERYADDPSTEPDAETVLVVFNAVPLPTDGP